ncbi:MAG: hypothetical protein N3B13_03070, partial [Deltaproteobacteria bacterium]|nr:hypothetical protein [Deltaproteobacteria bacterium]
PIVCVSAASRPMFRLRRSWDKFVVAPPFAGVCICFSEPLYIQGDNLRDGTDYYKRQIKEILHSLSEKSLKMLCEDAEKCDI